MAEPGKDHSPPVNHNPHDGDKDSGKLIALLYGLLMVAGLVVLVLGLVQARRNSDVTLVGLGVLALIIPAGLYPIAVAIRSVDRSLNRQTTQTGRSHRWLRSINHRLMVSDAAKRIMYREKDRGALRKAIREDIDHNDFDAALALVSQMSRAYGYHEEAEQFRDEILTARSVDTEKKVDQALARFDAILAEHDWEQAADEAIKIQRRFPDSDRAKTLPRRIDEARQKHKHDLEGRFLRAAGRDDVEEAIQLLTELDKYLSHTEAEPYRETARGVIGKKRDNLGVQFKLAIHDAEWPQAIRVGEQIIRAFPNTKMAQEVRGMLDLLRQRAAAQEETQT